MYIVVTQKKTSLSTIKLNSDAILTSYIEQMLGCNHYGEIDP